MKLSKDVIEAVLLIGAFAAIALAMWVVSKIWPVFPYGNWRIFLTMIVGGVIAVPLVFRLRRRLMSSQGKETDDIGQ
ncbi:MAG: hypothetical protein ACRCYS_13680 [Beijerinckiaceae bacterium]